MELEEGMYVRTRFGISKIIKDGNVKVIKLDNEETYDVDKNGRHYPNQFRDYIWASDVIKASHTLLGNGEEPCLIEVGDYVNGYKVSFIGNDYKPFVQCDYPVQEGTTNHYSFYEEAIYSIVTKEQFEKMQYSLEG